jgi:predicted small lipoprotein YifL
MHRIVEEELEDYLSGRGGRELTSHLTNCEQCRGEVAEMQTLSGLFGDLRAVEAVAVPLGFSNRLMLNINDRKSKSFLSIFAVDPGFTRKLALASLLCLAACGGYLATQPVDSVAPSDHTPEAVMASHDVSAPSDDPQHMDGMLVTLASYHQ